MISVAQINSRLNGGELHRTSPLAHTRFQFFNRSSSTSEDNRLAATDDAIVLTSGGFLFAPNRTLPNATAAATATGSKLTPELMAIVTAIVVGIAAMFLGGLWKGK